MPKLLELFLTFFKIGAFTFGGGYAMVPIIEDICVERKGWITHDEMMNVTVIAESTPGPIAINCATYVGHRRAGLLGSVIATLGVVLPSFIIIFAISKFLDRFLEIPVVANAFSGIKVGVGILIVNAAVKMIHKMKMTPLNIILLIAGFGVILTVNLLGKRFSSIVLMLAAGVVSVAVYLVQTNRAKKEGAAE